MASETKKHPASALTCDSPVPLQFAAGDRAEKAAIPITMTARTGGGIDHWYWGTIYHDFAGMQLSGDKIIVDWCHDDDEQLGYLDKFATDSGDLVVSGELVPFGDDDKVRELSHKSAAGVPYQASIDFRGPMEIEHVKPQATAEVNGKEISGPAVIVRKWNLRAVAVCPHGVDFRTSAKFADTAGDGCTVTEFTADEPDDQDDTTAADTETATPAPQAAAEPATPPARVATPPQSERAILKQFMADFGAQGAEWFAAGDDYAAAQRKFVDSLKDEIKQLRDELTAERTLGQASEPASHGLAKPRRPIITIAGKN